MVDAQLLEDLFAPDQSNDGSDLATLQMLSQGGGYGSQGSYGSPVMLGGAPPQMPWQGQSQQDSGGDVKGLSARIQELLGAKKPAGNDSIMNILSSRFNADGPGPSYGDYATGVVKSAMGTPTLGGDVASAGFTDTLKQLQALQTADMMSAKADLYRKGGTGSNGATMAVIQGLMAANPGMTFQQALYQYQTGNRSGTSLNPDQTISMMGGKTNALQNSAQATKTGTEQATLNYAAPIAAATVSGKGEITPVAQKAIGQNQMATVMNEFKTKVTALDKMGGLVNPNNSAIANVGAFAANTSGGQLGGKMLGTQAQSLRNDISSMEPVVINAIRQATGMSARAMDSNTELKFYREAVRAGDVKSQMNAINRILKMYGPGSSTVIPVEDTQAYEDSLGAQPATPANTGAPDYSHLWSQ